MKSLTRIGTPLLGAVAALVMMATSASADSIPTIRRDTATGSAYSGNIQATNLGNILFSGNAPFIGVVETDCTNADLRGSINSDGTGGVLSSLTLDNGSGTPCTNNQNGTTTITAENLDGTGAVTYDDPDTDARDGSLTIHSPDPDVRIKAVLTMDAVEGPQTCYYGLIEEADPVLPLYNRDNASRPNSADEAQGSADGQQFFLLPNEPNDFYCPDAAATYGVVKVRGETTAGSGTFDQKLYITD